MTVVSIGEVVVDWLATEPAEEIDEVAGFYRSLGGNASNVAIGLARLGTKARVIGQVGDDLHGRYLRKILAGEGVDLSYLFTDTAHPTAQCYVLTGKDGDHAFFNWPKPHAADMLAPDRVDRDCLKGASVVHATGISLSLKPRRQAVLKALSLAHEMGLVVSFDGTFPGGKLDHGQDDCWRASRQAMSLAHIVKLNRRELSLWWRMGLKCATQPADNVAIEEMAYEVFERYKPLALAVTLSDKGSILLASSGERRSQGFPVACVNGVGAGDGFVAGFIHALLKRCPGDTATPEKLARFAAADWDYALSLANACGALATTRLSAYEGLPRRDELDKLLAYG